VNARASTENRNFLAPPGFKAWIIQPVASRYTDYIIMASKELTGEKAVNDPVHCTTRNSDTHVDSVALLKIEDSRH
jgi:hypothetical protein